MSKMRSWLRSELPNSTETTAILEKVAGLFAQKSTRVVFAKGGFRINASLCDSVVIDPTLTHNNIQFARPPLDGGKEQFTVSTIADTGVKATASLATTTPIALTSALMGSSRNTNTFTLQILPAAANPSNTVLAAFTGTGAAIILTITPNDGTNNTATPVDLTTAQVRELITTGAVSGKSVTLTDGSSLRTKQTATGGGAAVVADGGEGDGVVATFASGANSNLNSKYFPFSDANDVHKYYAWMNVNGEGVDPAIGGRTGVPIAFAAGATANTIAADLVTAIAALNSTNSFTASALASLVTVTNKVAGPSTNATDGTAATGFTFTITKQIESYDTADIQIMRRLRTKKWLIRIKANANPEAL